MVEAVQSCVDNAVSKTVHMRQDATLRDIGQAVQRAWALGLKGCTVYREGSRGGEAVLLPRLAA